MRNIGDILKNNPIVVGSVVVALLALVVLFVIVKPAGSDFIKEMESRKQDEAKVIQFTKTSVPVPPKNPDDPPQQISTTITPAVLDAVSQINKAMTTQFSAVFKEAVEINQRYHEPMLEGLFPSPSGDAKLFDAQTEYRRTLREMLGRPTVADKTAPRLNAAPPVPFDAIDKELEKVTDKFLLGFGTRKSEADLTAEERKQLFKDRSDTAMKIVSDHAKRITMYAVADEESEEYPFHLGVWSNPGIRPQMRDIWEGQMNLWIQEDIVRAIAKANKEAGSDSVLNAPVKHLISIRVFDGYVGLTSMGGMGRMVDSRISGNQENVRQPGFADQVIQAADTRVILEEMQKFDPDQRLPEAFNVSMTGRVSNAIYDVRHAQLSVIVDWRQLPALFKAISEVNLMTVITTRVTDIDEYEALQAGYLYGNADCVQVELLIETIWLRDWTRELMPPEIKTELGIVEKPADGAAAAPGTTPTPGPGPGPGPGPIAP